MMNITYNWRKTMNVVFVLVTAMNVV